MQNSRVDFTRWAREGSNLRPLSYQESALATELRALLVIKMITRKTPQIAGLSVVDKSAVPPEAGCNFVLTDKSKEGTLARRFS